MTDAIARRIGKPYIAVWPGEIPSGSETVNSKTAPAVVMRPILSLPIR